MRTTGFNTWMQNKKVQTAALAVGCLIAGAIGHAIVTPEPVIAAPLPVEFRVGPGESPAKYVGNMTAIALGEGCNLPIYLGERQIRAHEITAQEARGHMAVTRNFTDIVQITVGVHPDARFQIVGSTITCPDGTVVGGD
ncbi:hypothetical protein KJ848_02450 [Patescibacteria group bacterium]|nr:hypothetical protein [Patescibacteria group bacterium]MBU2159017.1 hypothetical protein [Patescibacteria group bacterium]